MSGIDGIDVCTKLRNNAATAEVPVLMMSALANALEDCMEAGATDFIAKPFEMIHFQNKLKSLLEA